MPARPPKPQTVLQVLNTQWLTPSMVRVTAGGAGFDAFNGNGFTDKYAKLYFVRPELAITPPYDVAALREQLPQQDWPVVRTYTLRRVDEQQRTLAIDFVVHGDEGVAGPWAASARPGDVLVFTGPGGAYAPDPEADWHLLAGDQSALPAICSALEALPPDAVGVAFIEHDEHEPEQPVPAPERVAVQWIRRSDGDDGSTLLADAVDGFDWLDGDVQVFAHGERESMKALRDVFKRREVPRQRLSLSGYWARGRTEDSFQAEKREPIGKILD